jgi:release factor glutamine methyltransferase
MSDTAKTWRVIDILKVTEEAFKDKGIKNARLNAELLLCSVTGDKRIELYLNFEKPLTGTEVAAYREKVKRRLKFEPLQYILGKTEFYGLNFTVNNTVLIPRQESELIVDLVLEHIKTNAGRKLNILEIGTGSGCLPAAIAANAVCSIDAMDISAGAIATASRNAECLELKGSINFEVKDFLQSAVSFSGYDVVISNPPYIAADEVAGLNEEVNAYEPYEALTDGDDGLTFYRKIFELYNAGESNPEIFLETGDGKQSLIEDLLKKNGINDYIFHSDLMGIPRVIHLKSSER